ncbi:hypothetical protein D1007_54229 [Hordeum vulgare]|nr:hypothetical protein D1007_54229 [Hordeum vulgare]
MLFRKVDVDRNPIPSSSRFLIFTSIFRRRCLKSPAAPTDVRDVELQPADADAFEGAILARSSWEEEEELQRCQREEEINAVLYEQGLAKAIAFGEKEEEWRREKKEQEKIYVGHTFNED